MTSHRKKSSYPFNIEYLFSEFRQFPFSKAYAYFGLTVQRHRYLEKAMEKTVLILDPDDTFCAAAAEAFWNAGWHIRLANSAPDDHMTEVTEIIVTNRATLKSAADLARKSDAMIVVPRGVRGRFAGHRVRSVSLSELRDIGSFTPPDRRRRRSFSFVRWMPLSTMMANTFCGCRQRS
ncbi:hypothetical protein [Roseovarius sp. E0-M6]|uniref:hypothetical protein n=1 Tax=Roseovarius sp. E0-M6 TaxID=3127118 RepID=UPI00300F827C